MKLLVTKKLLKSHISQMLKVGSNMSKNLINDSKVQSVIIKLDKNKPRELKFRQHLGSKRREGMNMKETYTTIV